MDPAALNLTTKVLSALVNALDAAAAPLENAHFTSGQAGSLSVTKSAWISMDWQRVRNRVYNADRGPVSLGTVPLHVEY